MSKKNVEIDGITVKKVSRLNADSFLALAFCWANNGKKGFFYDYVPVSFACHPCDLFDKKGNRESWKDLTEYTAENCINMLPENAEYLRKNIAGGIQVSNFGRVGLPIYRKKDGLCKGCSGCGLEAKCKDTFHYILPQYEECIWANTNQEFKNYNGWLVVDTNKGQKKFMNWLPKLLK